VVFDDVAGEHHVFIRHVDDDVARGMRAAQMHQIDAAVAQIDRHIVGKGGGGVGQAGDGFVPLKQAGEALEFAVPVLLPAFHDHRAGGVAHDDLIGAVSRGPQHTHRVIVGQHHMADGFVGDAADLFDDLARQTRGGLCLHDHDAVVADDHAGVRVAFGGEGPQIAAHLVEGDFLFGQVALGCECFGHWFLPYAAHP